MLSLRYGGMGLARMRYRYLSAAVIFSHDNVLIRLLYARSEFVQATSS
jgi:hypothetical protein